MSVEEIGGARVPGATHRTSFDDEARARLSADAAVITYERNSWGNKGGEVQPAEVAARRK